MNYCMSKNDFVSAIEDIKSVIKYQDGLNSYFRKNGVDGYIFQPDCVSTVLRLLHNIWGDADKDNWIDYFCLDLDCGRTWKPGTITDNNGADIKLETAEDLYNYLCKYE